MTVRAPPLRAQTKHRLSLVAAVLALALLISAGTVYIQRTPALSTRALFASAQEAFLAYQLSGLDARPDSGTSAESIPVLTYHRIVSDSSDVSNVTASRFKDQMVSLKKAGWETITLQEFEEFMEGKRELPERSFLLTFDDGAKDSFYPVDPILAALGYEAVNFIIVAASETPHSTYYLNPLEIQRMLDTGRWSIGSHSFDGHRPYPTDGSGGTGIFFADRLWQSGENRLETESEFSARVHDDLARSKSALASAYHVPIRSFAFPLGNETGINGANNFAGGSILTEREAARTYDFGYLQLASQRFMSNFPRTGSSTPRSPSDDFRVFRIHVDYDWDGARVVELLENTLQKPLPYEDDFSTDHGWIPSWGNMELGRNNLALRAAPETTSASAFLDGTARWDEYTFDAAVNWQRGHAIILGDVTQAGTYRSCVFSPGVVRIQETIEGMARTLAEVRNPAIAYGDVRIGIRSHGKVTECAWNFASVAEEYSRTWTGGIGMQTWDESPGVAQLTVSSIIVRPYDAENP